MTRFHATYKRKHPVTIRQDVTVLRCDKCGLEYRSFRPLAMDINAAKGRCPDKKCGGTCKEVTG